MTFLSPRLLGALLAITVIDQLLGDGTLLSASLPITGVAAFPISHARIGIVIKQDSSTHPFVKTNQAKTVGPLIGIKTDGMRSTWDSNNQKTAAKAFETTSHVAKRSLKLSKVELRIARDDDVPMILQRQLNRANSKLARIRGYDAPTASEMATALHLRRRFAALRRSPEDQVPETRRTGKHGRLGNQVVGDSGDSFNKKRLVGGLLGGVLGGVTQDGHAASTAAGSASSDETASDVPAPAASTSSASNTIYGTGNLKSTASGADDGHGVDSQAGYPTLNMDAATDGQMTVANGPTAANSLGLDIEANDVGYIATIKIGSNKQEFRMLIDSGSADTWVAGTSCQQCGSSHQMLGSASSTFESTARNFSITYGTGAVSGFMASDDVDIAGLQLPKHPLGIASVETKDFSDSSVPFDGLMGLAKSELSNAQVSTPIDALYASGLVTAPVMGYHLARVADGRNGSSDGEVTFGGVDAARFDGDLLEIPNVSEQGFWEARMSAVSFGGQDLGLANRTAILDTGTTLILAPQADADALHAAIPGSRSDGQGGYYIPCTVSTHDGQGPTLELSFAGTKFPLDTRDLTFLPLDQSDLQGDCVSAISAGSVGQADEWLVGAAFLKNVYFATNSQLNVIGLAKLADPVR